MWIVTNILLCSLFLTIYGLSNVSRKNVSIVIVGTGPSGIAAATWLLRHQFNNIKLLEAEDRIGGRIYSVKFGDAYVDLGAEYCHGQNGNVVYSMVKDYDILRHSVADNWSMYRSNGEQVSKDLSKKIVNFADSFAATDQNIAKCETVSSIGECVDIKTRIALSELTNGSKEAEVLEEAIDWVKTYLSSYDSPLDLNDLNITTNYQQCGGDLYMNWNGLGYKTILEIMMQKYPDKTKQLPIDAKIMLKKTVENITGWNQGDQVLVTTTNGEEFTADHVIFTPSLGVLKADYEKLFDPGLDAEKIRAINERGFGAILKVIMHFSERWWSEITAYSLIWTSADKEILKERNLGWLTNINAVVEAENNPNVLIAWYAGAQIPIIEQLSAEDLLKGHKHMLNKFFSKNFNVTMPDKIIRTNWYSNPHFRGTYSYDSVKETPGRLHQDQLASPLRNENGKPTVLFAGEATHPIYFSTVHGAIESGYREASRLAQLYNETN